MIGIGRSSRCASGETNGVACWMWKTLQEVGFLPPDRLDSIDLLVNIGRMLWREVWLPKIGSFHPHRSPRNATISTVIQTNTTATTITTTTKTTTPTP